MSSKALKSDQVNTLDDEISESTDAFDKAIQMYSKLNHRNSQVQLEFWLQSSVFRHVDCQFVR